jgi:hypothetical protein
MTWLTWRLQRAELLLLGLTALAVGAALLQSHADVVARAQVYTPETCPVPLSGTEGGCLIPVSRIFQIVQAGLPWFNFLPLIAAVLLALPLVSEIENGTYRLAWTQGVTRGRWARTKLGVVTLGAVAFAAISALTFHWWRSPMDELNGRLGDNLYALRGTIPIGYALFALGLTLAFGVILRRPVVALVLATGGYVATVIPFGLWIRPHLIVPIVQSDAEYLTANPAQNLWFLDSYWQDAAGKRISDAGELCSWMGAGSGRQAWERCIAEHNLVHYQVYHPDSHYWSLQLAETGIFLVAGLVLLGFAAWYLLRRVE